MTYYVLDPSGAQYGPADLAMLQQWQREGRILASTSIRDATTGHVLPPSSIPGLIQPQYASAPTYNQGPSSPYANPPTSYNAYPAPAGYGTARNDVMWAWIMAITGLVVGLCFCPLLAIGFGVGGWYFARRAQQYGDINAQGPLITSYVVIALGVLFTFLGFAIRSML
jgi:hypothetical protein